MGDANAAQNDIGGVQFAEVAVDTETGVIRVERVVAVQDCGRPMNPKLIESQVQGGVLMGISYALLEQRIIDQHTGHMVNANLEQYKLAGPRETPPIEVVLLENYQGQSATDAYGIAEPSNIATAPAIANAVFNAIGVRLRELPMTPAAVLTRSANCRGGAEAMERFAWQTARSVSRGRGAGKDHRRRCDASPMSRRQRRAEGRRHRSARPDEGGPAAAGPRGEPARHSGARRDRRG